MDDCDASGSPGTLAVNRSGRAVLKEGAVVAVGESSPQEEKTDYRRRHKQRPQREGVVMHVTISRVYKKFVLNVLACNVVLYCIHRGWAGILALAPQPSVIYCASPFN
jgi:hypothetical protein